MDAHFESEIESLYLRMYDMLFVYAKANLANSILAEEAVQETFVIACRKPEALCFSERPEGWLVNTLKYVISNMRRQQAAAMDCMLSYLSLYLTAQQIEENTISLNTLYDDVCKTEEFKLIKELAVDKRSIAEMAFDRGISVPACKKRVQRAKEFLRKKIE